MKPKNEMTAEHELKNFAQNARIKLLPMARVLDARAI